MNLQSVVVVVLRLMALNFLLQLVVQLTPQLIQLFRIYDRSTFEQSPVEAAFPWIILAGLIASSVLLWVFALPIARFVTRRVPQEVSFGSVSLLDCYSIAFLGVGLFYIASHLPQVLNWSHYLFVSAASTPGSTWKEQIDWYPIFQSFITFIVGIILFVNGRSWALALARKQQKSESPNQTVERTGAPPLSSDLH